MLPRVLEALIVYLAHESKVYQRLGEYSDLEAITTYLLTAAGQCRTCTRLSPLPLVAVHQQNRSSEALIVSPNQALVVSNEC